MKKLIAFVLCILLCLPCFTFFGCAENDKKCAYDIVAQYDETTATLNATMDFSFYNYTDNALSFLKFNLYANAYREDAKFKPVATPYREKAYYSGDDFGCMKIESVSGCKAWSVGGVDENVLVVEFDGDIYPDQTQKLRVQYSVKLAKVNHRTGVGQTSVSLANFYPVLCFYDKTGFLECPYYDVGDPYVSECANYSLTLVAPENYAVCCGGVLTGERVENGLKTSKFTAKNTRDFTVLLSPNFSVLSAKADDVDVKYYYVSDQNAQDTLDLACKAIDFFESAFGAYPYPTYTLVETDLYYGGMEYGALATVGKDLSASAKIYATVHETAHMWWAEGVGCDQINCSWLDEGLAEYSTFLFFDAHKDYGFSKTALVGEATKSYRAYYSVYNQIFGDVNTTMTRAICDFASEYEYVNIAYNKSALMFESLFNTAGESNFFASLKDFFNCYKYKVASPDALIACFLAKDGKCQGFFDAFLQGKIII